MNKVLKDYAYYVTETLPNWHFNSKNYIGVDNLLPNRQGIKESEYVPSEGNFISFRKGDILVGNIRPYFKKIWFAEFDGGCSPDVLCIRCKDNIPAPYLFSYLSQDSFFNYAMVGAKGSKMPRGDREHIMNFPIKEQKNMELLGTIFQDIYKKIQNNNKQIQTLESLAKTIYDYWFVQFDFPNEDGKPYKSSGGKMVWNEELKREIPEGWKAGVLSDIADIKMGQSPKGESYNQDKKGATFFQGCSDFGYRFPYETTYTIAPTRIAQENDILLSVRAPVGTLNIALCECCIGRGLSAIRHKENCQSYLYYLLNNTNKKFNIINSTFAFGF